jgi:hypothetical protein
MWVWVIDGYLHRNSGRDCGRCLSIETCPKRSGAKSRRLPGRTVSEDFRQELKSRNFPQEFLAEA